MKCIFEVNSRTSLVESAEQKHEKLIDFLKGLESPWGIAKDLQISFPGFKKEFTATSTLSKFMENGIKLSAYYRYRNKLENHHSNDDRIYIEFNSKKINYEDLVNNIFPQFIKRLDAYTADIYNEQLILKNYEEKRFKNRREIINRVYPVSFYDATLCNSFFKLSPEKVANLLKKNIYKAEVSNKGILIIADIIPLSVEASIEFENLIKSILKY